jgi:hypothetical protein
MEDIGSDVKNFNFCNEYENVYQKINMEFDDKVDKITLKPKKSIGPNSPIKKLEQNIPEFYADGEEYSFIKNKSLPVGATNDFEFKTRSNSILKFLVNNLEGLSKVTSTDA